MPLPPGFVKIDNPTIPVNQINWQSNLPEGFVPVNPKELNQLKESSATDKALSLVSRFGKQIVNAIPKILDELKYGASGQRGLDMLRSLEYKRLAKEQGTPISGKEALAIAKEKSFEKLGNVPSFDISSPATTGEKITDTAAGITTFVVELAALKKIMPGVSDKALWEVQNLLNGGDPGQGAAMHTVFGVPGKLIPGKSLAAKGGRIAAESTLMGGLSAVEQKLNTGEIDWKDVAVQAGIPVALHSLGYVKSRVKAKDPVVLKAIEKITNTPVESKETSVEKPQIPLPQQNVYVGKDSGKTYIEPFAESGSKQMTQQKEINGENKVFHTETGEELISRPDLARGTKETEEQYLARTQKQEVKDTSIESVSKELEKWSVGAEKIKKEEWEPELKKLHAAQIQESQGILEKARSEGVQSQERLRRIKAGFKQKAVRPEVKPPEFADEQWNSISEQAEKTYKDDTPKLMNLQESLDNLRYRGKIPTDYEFGLLEPVLGFETVAKLHENLATKRTFTIWDAPKLIISALKSPFGFDPQAPRQLISLLPKYPKIWAKSAIINIQSYLNKSVADKLSKELEARPSWKSAQESGLNLVGTKPWKKVNQQRLQQYGDWTEFLYNSKNRVLKGIGRVLKASERGANLGIDWALLEIWEKESRLLQKVATKNNWNEQQIKTYESRKAKDINAFAKRVVARKPEARKIQEAANMVLFSPAYTVSRPYATFRSVANLFKSGPIDRFYAIDLTLRNIAMISAMSTIGSLIAYKSRANKPDQEPEIQGSMNPTNSLWGKLRIGNQVIDLSFGDASYYRLLARLGVSAYAYTKELSTGHEVTKLGNTQVRPVGEEFKKYIESRETVALGLAKTLLTGKDWLGQPVEWKSFLAETAMPMSALKDLVEAGHADGLWESLYNGELKKAGKTALRDIPMSSLGVMGVGVSSYPVSPATTRSNFRDFIASKNYNKDWSELTLKEQRELERKYRKQLTILDKETKQDRIENPVNVQKIIEEEKRIGEKIRGRLNKESQLKTVGVSLNVNRRPDNFYLNDERFARYQDLIVSYLNDKLSKSKNPKPETVKTLVKIAKSRAWYQLKREMK